MLVIASVLLALTANTLAGPATFPHRRSSCSAPSILWQECDSSLLEKAEKAGIKNRIACANLVVPLDYTDTRSNKTHTLELVRVAASTNGTSKGSIIFNFGGPGTQGTTTLVDGSGRALNYTGGEYDLISFNPRGTSPKYLGASCFESAIEKQLAFLPNPGLELIADSSKASAGWAHTAMNAKAVSNQCKKGLKDKGELMGTAFTARDVMAIVDALGEQKLNYWGISYGTALGATLVAMFPKRMGRVVLDGVVNPYFYYEAYGGPSQPIDLDAAFYGLLEACVEAGPEICPLAAAGTRADDILQKVKNLVSALNENPLPWPAGMIDFGAPYGTYIDGNAIRALIFNAMYSPSNYLKLTFVLASVLKGDLSLLAEVRSLTNMAGSDTEPLLAIMCSDKRTARNSSVEAAQANYDLNKQESWVTGTSAQLIMASLACAQWPFAAKERYQGDFNVDVSESPILVLGNTYDPVTPLSSARNVTEGLKGSVLVQLNGFGHGVNAHPSTCIGQVAGKYFSEGQLPQPGLVCEPDFSLTEMLKAARAALEQ